MFEYALVDRTGNLDLQQLRSLQDWNLRYALESVPGVAEVASVGGFVKQYQVIVDPNKLLGYDIPLRRVIQAVRESNHETGGRVIEIAAHEQMVRARGYVTSKEDLELAPLAVSDSGVPITIKDVAEVRLGPDMRRGLAELDGEGEVVGAIVVMRYGENALDVIHAVKERIGVIERSLPDGVEIVVTYDRSELIEASIETLKDTLIEEMIVVSVVIFLFLMHVRSALIPIITLPLGVLLAFIPMFYQGLTINIMSLGGIAVAIGAMVDAAIIIIENIHKKLEQWDDDGSPGGRTTAIIEAMQEVGPSIFFSLLVITVSFMPVFTLEGVEGRLFKPLAFTKTYSMGFAAILAVTLTPALAATFIRGKIRREERSLLNRWLVAAYAPIVRLVVRFRKTALAATLFIMLATIPAFLDLGSEFMPPLNEGAILYMPTAPPGMSITEAATVLQSMDRKLRRFPEVERVFGKMGRARTATDPAPIGMVESVVLLKPKDQWRPGLTWDDLVAEMDRELNYPGMPNIWWMPIQTRVEMLTTGIRSQLGIKVFGDDSSELEKASIAIEQALPEVPGTRNAFAERATGGFFLDVAVNRREAARYGLSVQNVNEVVMTAIGGQERLGNCRRPGALPDSSALRARISRPSRSTQKSPRRDAHRCASASVSGSRDSLRDGPANDPKRGRTARELRLCRHRRPAPRRLCGRSAAPSERACGASSRDPARMGGSVRLPEAGEGATRDRHPSHAPHRLHSPLHEHRLHHRDRYRLAGGSVLSRGCYLADVAPRLQHEYRRLGGSHRPRRARRRDGCDHAALSQARLRSTSKRRSPPVLRRPSRNHRGRRRSADPSKADDGADHHDWTLARHVEHGHGSRRDEADRRTDGGGIGDLVRARAHHLSGHFRHLEKTRAEPRRRWDMTT